MFITSRTVLIDDHHLTVFGLRPGSREHDALLTWCRDHGISPDETAADQTFVRHTDRPRVEADTYEVHADGTRHLASRDGALEPAFRKYRRIINLDHEPAPWPDLLWIAAGHDCPHSNRISEQRLRCPVEMLTCLACGDVAERPVTTSDPEETR